MTGNLNELQVKRIFGSLQNVPASNFPSPTSLSTELEKLVTNFFGVSQFNVPLKIIQLFATASIEMWHRSLHSYLVSLSNSETSHIWSSVSGYYSSHYAIRSIAHALGAFQLFEAGKIIEIDLINGNNLCNVRNKSNTESREHSMYWRYVKRKSPFDLDPLFTINRPHNGIFSDAKHRERGNYADHIGQVPFFQPLTIQSLKNRADHISNISLDDPPIPDFALYPQLENVQIVAYHRMVKARNYLDSILGNSINFWNVNRNPPWARQIVNYHTVESGIGDYISR